MLLNMYMCTWHMYFSRNFLYVYIGYPISLMSRLHISGLQPRHLVWTKPLHSCQYSKGRRANPSAPVGNSTRTTHGGDVKPTNIIALYKDVCIYIYIYTSMWKIYIHTDTLECVQIVCVYNCIYICIYIQI